MKKGELNTNMQLVLAAPLEAYTACKARLCFNIRMGKKHLQIRKHIGSPKAS